MADHVISVAGLKSFDLDRGQHPWRWHHEDCVLHVRGVGRAGRALTQGFHKGEHFVPEYLEHRFRGCVLET